MKYSFLVCEEIVSRSNRLQISLERMVKRIVKDGIGVRESDYTIQNNLGETIATVSAIHCDEDFTLVMSVDISHNGDVIERFFPHRRKLMFTKLL